MAIRQITLIETGHLANLRAIAFQVILKLSERRLVPESSAERLNKALTAKLSRLPRLIGIGLIRLYRLTLSPLIGRQCRYLPTCSEYTEEAVSRFGLWPGSWIGLSRLQRCGPMGASGFDPVPETLPVDAAWYTPWRYGHWTGKHIHPDTRLDL